MRSLEATAKSMHNVLLAHGHAIEAMRASGQKNLGIVLNKTDVEPASDSDRDISSPTL